MFDTSARIFSRCPNCDFENTTLAEATKTRIEDIVLCDVDEGGCDKYYAIIANRHYNVATYAMTRKDRDHEDN